jgi:hypothetical protein
VTDYLKLRKAAIEKVPCQACSAGAGQPCRGPGGGKPQVPHFPRREAAYAAGHMPVKDGAR